MTYCVVPKGTDPAVTEALRHQYADDPTVAVVVDERAGEPTPGSDLLKQRRPVLSRVLPGSEVPGARLEQHMPPVDVTLAEQPLESIIALAAQYDPAASTELRWRSYALVLEMLTDRIGNRATAHRIVPRVMDAIQEALPTYPPQGIFAAWLMAQISTMPLDL